MIFLAMLCAIFFGLSFFSAIHALGIWLMLLVAHGLLVQLLGELATHLPFFAGLAVTAGILFRREWSGVPPRILFFFGCLIAVMAIAALLGLDVNSSLISLLLYSKGFLLALLLAGCLKREKDISKMTLYCFASLIVGALITLYQFKTGTFTISTIYIKRAASLRGDPNDTAMLLIAGIPLAVYWLIRSKSLLSKGLFVSSILLLLVGVVLTGSRGGFVALIVISLAIYFKKPTFRMSLSVLLLLAIAMAIAPQHYWDRMETLITGQEKHGSKSLESRLLLQKKGLNIFIDHPMLGVGPGNYGRAFIERSRLAGGIGSSHSTLSTKGDRGIVAHNMHLEFLVENGMIGSIFLLIIFTMALHGVIKFDRKTRSGPKDFGLGFAIAVALAGMLFAGLFLSQGKNSVLWFMIGVGLAANRVTKGDPRGLFGSGYHHSLGVDR